MCTSTIGLFSATQTEAVEALARAGLRNPVKVNVAVTLTGASQGAAVQKTPSTLQLLVCRVVQALCTTPDYALLTVLASRPCASYVDPVHRVLTLCIVCDPCIVHVQTLLFTSTAVS